MTSVTYNTVGMLPNTCICMLHFLIWISIIVQLHHYWKRRRRARKSVIKKEILKAHDFSNIQHCWYVTFSNMDFQYGLAKPSLEEKEEKEQLVLQAVIKKDFKDTHDFCYTLLVYYILQYGFPVTIPLLEEKEKKTKNSIANYYKN